MSVTAARETRCACAADRDAVGPGERARRAAAELLLAYSEVSTTTEREQVAAVIATLTPHGAMPLAELAREALKESL